MMNFEEMDEEEEEEEAPDSDEEENFQKARLSAQGRFGAGGDLRVPMELHARAQGSGTGSGTGALDRAV